MAKTKITLPTMEQQPKAVTLTDWEITNGAICSSSTYDVNGEKQRQGDSWTCESYGDNEVRVRGYGDVPDSKSVSSRDIVARPRIQNPKRSEITTRMTDDGKEFLTIQGKTVYYPNTKVSGKIKIIRPVEYLSFRSDILPHQSGAYENTPFTSKKNQCYKIVANDIHGFAVKVDNPIKRDDDSCYRDGTRVEEGKAVWHWLEPLPAKKQENGDIQTLNGLPIQFETQSKYEKKIKSYEKGAVLNTDDFQIGDLMTDLAWEWRKSAEVLAALTIDEKTAVPVYKKKKTRFADMVTKIGLRNKKSKIEQKTKDTYINELK